MKGLIYPLVGLVVITVTAVVVTGLIIRINRYREHRAIARARWEMFTDTTDGFTAQIGIRCVARWGRQERVLVRDTHPVTVDLDNTVAVFDAQNTARMRADTVNALLGGEK